MFGLLPILSSKTIAKAKISNIFNCLCILIFLLVLGITGLFYRALEGVNYIVVGFIMIWICSKSRHSGGGGEYIYKRLDWGNYIINIRNIKNTEYDIK